MEQDNPCCVELKKRYLKLEEKRNALRQAVKLLEHQINKIESENIKLKQEVESERGRAETEKEGREKEFSLRKKLEEEVNNLRSELLLLQNKKCKAHSPDEIQLLESRALDAECEIKRLNKLLDEGKKKAESEKKKTEVEKRKASEAWTLVNMERKKAEEERRLRENEEKKMCEFKISAEEAITEATILRKELMVVKKQVDDANKRAESEKLKAEKRNQKAGAGIAEVETLKKAAEAEKKKAMEEKFHADNLYQQLKVETQKREKLEEVVKRISTENGRSSHCTCGDHVKGEDAEAKILKMALKIEKKQKKCARKKAKIQEAEKNLVLQELDFLKRRFSQFEKHLNMVDDILLHNSEGIHQPRKLDKCPYPVGFNRKGEFTNALLKCCNIESRNDLTQASLKNLCCFNCKGAAMQHPGPLLSYLGVNCHPPGSGINSDLESPIGDSLRQKKQTSVTCSTTASFSDGQFMGSQDRCQSLADPATELRCISTSCISDDMAKCAKGKSNGALRRKNGQGCNQIDVAAVFYEAVDHEDNGHNRKKRKFEDMLESLTSLCSEDRKLHLKIEENLAAISGLVLDKKLFHDGDMQEIISKRPHTFGCSNDRKIASVLKEDTSKKRKSGSKSTHWRNRIKEPVATRNMIIDSNVECGSVDGKVTQQNILCSDKTNNFCIEDHILENLPCFKDMMNGNIMKIFELDNAIEEERYRAAVASPISPSLPVLEPPSFDFEKSGKGESCYLIEDILRREFGCRESNMELSDRLDVVDLEIDVSQWKSMSSNVHESSVSHEHYSEETRSDVAGTCFSEFGETQLDNKHACFNETSHKEANFPSSHTSCKPHIDSVDGTLESISISHNVVENSSKPISFILKEPEALSLSCTMESSHNNPSKRDSGHVVNACNQADILQEFHESSQLGTDLGENNLMISCLAGSSMKLSLDRDLLEGEIDHLPSIILTDGESNSSSDGAGEDFLSSMKFQETSVLKKVQDPCDAGRFQQHQDSGFSIICFRMEDKCGIIRIASSVLAIACQMPVVERKNDIKKIVHAILEINLELSEKVCVMFSFLIDLYSGLASTPPQKSSDDSLSPEMVKSEIQTVISDEEIGHLFLDICQGGNFHCLVQEFLVNREILSCVPIQGNHVNLSYSSDKVHHLRGGDAKISLQKASSHQLFAACLILASYCSVLDHVDFVQDASCNILLNCRSDFSRTLGVLHTFASVCGTDYLLNKRDGTAVLVIKCAVLLLELREYGANSRLDIPVPTENIFKRCTAKNCPFVQDPISVDEVIQILLRGLEESMKLALGDNIQNKVAVNPIEDTHELSMPAININKGQACISVDKHESDISFPSNDLLASCSDMFMDEIFLGFMDTVSSLELLGCYLDHDLLRRQILPFLLRLSESCRREEYYVALLVLVGKLSRLLIETGGYGKNDLADVRRFLLRCLGLSTSGNSKPLLAQFAAFQTILDLLPTEFEELMSGTYEVLNFDGEGLCESRKGIQDWFSQLKDEHKLSLKKLFQCWDPISNG